MIDEKLLDEMNFGELNQALEYVIEKIDKLQAEGFKGKEHPAIDMLCVFANKIITRMDTIIHEFNNPEALAQWNKVMVSYQKGFEKYTDILLEEGTILDAE